MKYCELVSYLMYTFALQASIDHAANLPAAAYAQWLAAAGPETVA